MKKVFRYVLGGLAAIVLLIAAAALFIQWRGIPTYDKPTLQQSVELTPNRVVRGKKLASMLCAGCHFNAETQRLSGKHMKDAPAEFGEIHAPNITQDAQHGIANYTDGELIYLLRTGVKRNGQYAPPYMAKLPHMSDEDLQSIVAFLRSDDPWVQPTPIASTPSQPSFLTKFLAHVAFKPLPMPARVVPQPDTTDLVAFGRYLTTNLDCWTCHSGDFTKLDMLNPEQSFHYLAGGNKMPDNDGRIMNTLNLTPDKETGIGSWTEEQFIKAVKFGLKDGEPALRYPMVPYLELTDYEAKAIYAYLQTVPPIRNSIKRTPFD